ncbi:MAG: prepilin-type N-terminal cleavage/methylation domain-containing protein [Kofleriaceae bacterium]
MRARRLHSRFRPESGLTLLEVMIVIAIIGIGLIAMRSGFRAITKADLAEDATELETYLRRASLLAVENGEQHRVVMDFETGAFIVERCEGAATLARNEQLRNDEDKVKQALEKGNEKLKDLPQDALAVGDPEEATKRATAIAGHHIADRTCMPVTGGFSGQVQTRKKEDTDWLRHLSTKRGIKFKEIWVQHKDDSTTKGQVAVYFFPNGSSEKAVIEVTDGDAIHTILIHGLTGRVQHKSSKLEDIDDHMLRNAMGDRDKSRDSQ